jgi:RNA polymerase sigma factor (sigma-70 family)
LSQAHTITIYQPLLHKVAYNLLRCKADAEDIVQDTLLKWLCIDQTNIENTKAYLVKAVTNNCLNHLQSLKKKKEEYWDNLHLSDLLVKFKESDFGHLDFEKELSAAFKVIQTKLEPLERAAYLLRDVFDFDYAEIQKVLDKKADHCRQLLSRARKKVEEEKGKINFGMPGTSHLFESFKHACRVEDASEFIRQLKKDIAQTLKKPQK